ncbi:MAG: YfhO family protein [Lachnospiraceae bacterium]|nr:YfhO family protein [Lachnospiraceae bacterium]
MKFRKPLPLPLISFVLALTAFLFFLLIYKVLGYGNYTILRGDLFVQYIDFIKMFLRVLKGEEDFWYSFSIYLGSGTILTYAYYAFSPFNLLYLLDFISIPAMTIVIISLKVSLAASTFTVFAKRVLKCNGPVAVFFSLCYALNSFSIALHFNVIWLDAVYMLPLLVLLIFILVDKGDFLPLVPAWAYMFLTNFYMAYICGIFTAIVFLALLIVRKYPIKRCFTTLLKFAAGVILAVCCSAAILLPCAGFLIAHMAADNVEFSPLPTNMFDVLNSLFIGSMPDIDNRTPLMYCSIPSLLLIPFYFINKNIRKTERIMTGLVLLIYILAMVFLPLFIVMHAFDYPNFYFFRYSFCVSFVLCCMACRSLSFPRPQSSIRLIWLYSGGLLILYSFMISFAPLYSRAEDSTNTKGLMALNLLFIIIWCTFFSVKNHVTQKNIRKTIYTIAAFILVITELAINGKICMDHTKLLPISEDEYNYWYESQSKALSEIPADDKDFYRVTMYGDNNYNSPSFYGYAGFNTFSSSDDYNLRIALYSLGISGTNRSITENGYTDITRMLLSTGYIAKINTVSEGSPVRSSSVMPFEYRLPVAYMVSSDIRKYIPQSGDPFKNQETLCELMTGTKRSFYEKLDLSDISVSSFNATMYEMGTNKIFHKITDYKNTAGLYFTMPLNQGKRFMVCFRQDTSTADSNAPYILCGEDCFSVTPTLSEGCIFSGGYQNGSFGENTETVVIYYNENSINDYPCRDIYAAYYYEDNTSELYNDLRQAPFFINEWHGGYFKGSVQVPDDRSVLFTSIPYDKDWSATVDGAPAAITPVLGDAFIALDLTPGSHEITLKYNAPGKRAGISLSIAGILIFIILLITQKIRTNR